MQPRARSHFGYAITRPYPFPWFDYVVAVFLIICTVIFTVLNFATSGYNLKTVYTTDPNSTLAHHYWFQKAPWSWLNSIEATCDAASLPTGS